MAHSCPSITISSVIASIPYNYIATVPELTIMLQCQIKYLLKQKRHSRATPALITISDAFRSNPVSLICFNLEHRMAIKNQKHSCHRFGRPRFNEPPPPLRLVPEIFDHKVAEASLMPPKLGLTGRRENCRAPRLTCLRSPLAWGGTFPRGGSGP